VEPEDSVFIFSAERSVSERKILSEGVVDYQKIFYCIFGLKTQMSDVTFAICHFRFSPIGLEIFVSNPHPSLFFGTLVFIFRSEDRLSRDVLEEEESQQRRSWGVALQQRRTWRWSASAGIVSQREVVGY